MVRFQLAKMSRWFGVAMPAVMICAAGLQIAPAHAQEINYGQVVDLVERQAMLIEKMSKESLLIALDSKGANRLATLQHSHELFSKVQTGLREGNRGLGLPAATNPHILDRLALVDSLWPLFDGAIRSALATGAVGRGEIDTLTEMSQPIVDALGGAADAYLAESNSQQLRSMLETTISAASRQRLLSQRMAKEFFLIAYRHQDRKNRSHLKKSTELFDQSMKTLMQGSPQERQIAPPTLEIRSQLEAAHLVWIRLKPLMEPALAGNVPNEDEIVEVADLTVDLLEAMNQALTLYMAL